MTLENNSINIQQLNDNIEPYNSISPSSNDDKTAIETTSQLFSKDKTPNYINGNSTSDIENISIDNNKFNIEETSNISNRIIPADHQ